MENGMGTESKTGPGTRIKIETVIETAIENGTGVEKECGVGIRNKNMTGALFYLPEFKSSTSSVNDSVYNVYKRIQKAGPELLMPPPLAQNDIGDIGIIRHGEEGDDPHILEDRNRLKAKIEEEMGMKVLERPQFDPIPSVSSSKGPSKPPVDAIEEPMPENNNGPSKIDSLHVDGSHNKYVAVALTSNSDPELKLKLDTIKEMGFTERDNEDQLRATACHL
ncbi:hypothetical protein EVAR_92518_1 [Eumeta japonica]|uniref:Uncharacterized protein n=1 Tax=Eumeta variegata TaxID=151549 RepID=A0A4C1T718_EUMVA|nr:hypothetical protein EVAR_92518_1 [Eumeta japonica]